MDACDLCHKTSQQAKLRLCTVCGEAVYCFRECQRESWKSHKIQCGQTDRIEFESFYPFLACISHSLRCLPSAGVHPALCHKILNSSNTGRELPLMFPNGVAGTLVVLGESIPGGMRLEEWWPDALSDANRDRLWCRIVTEGRLLPIVLSLCIALASEIYTTAAVPGHEKSTTQVTGRRRVRITDQKSPIADFGIVHGSVLVPAEDRLVYISMEDKSDKILVGQNPDDHYKMYFTTLTGDEYYLNVSMKTFDVFEDVVDIAPYIKHFEFLDDLKTAPACLTRPNDRSLDGVHILKWRPRKRFSILRDPRVHRLIQNRDLDSYCTSRNEKATIYSIMDDIAGMTCHDIDKMFAVHFLPKVTNIMKESMRRREYVDFPKESKIYGTLSGKHIHPDDYVTDEQVEEAEKELSKWARKLKKGKMSPAQWEAAAGNLVCGSGSFKERTTVA